MPNISNVEIPADVIAGWKRKEATDITKQRKALMSEREQLLIEQETELPKLRQATADARAREEVKLAEYKEAQEATRVAYGAEIDAVANLDHAKTQIERELRKTRPTIIDEFIRQWEDEFAKLGNQILPRSITRPMPGKYTPGGESIMESVSNNDSIGRRKVALRRAIAKARTEIPLIAASEAEARQMLQGLYNNIPTIEPPQFPDEVKRT